MTLALALAIVVGQQETAESIVLAANKRLEEAKTAVAKIWMEQGESGGSGEIVLMKPDKFTISFSGMEVRFDGATLTMRMFDEVFEEKKIGLNEAMTYLDVPLFDGFWNRKLTYAPKEAKFVTDAKGKDQVQVMSTRGKGEDEKVWLAFFDRATKLPSYQVGGSKGDSITLRIDKLEFDAKVDPKVFAPGGG